MAKNQDTGDRLWRALTLLLRRRGACVEETKAHGLRGLFVTNLPFAPEDVTDVVRAVEAFGRKRGLPIAGRMSPKGGPQLLIFTAPA